MNAGKDIFFSILAHDLKNPMQNLVGLSEVLVDTMPEGSGTEYRETARDVRTRRRGSGISSRTS